MQRTLLSLVLTTALAGVAGAAPLGAQRMGAPVPQVTGNLTYHGGPVLSNVKVVTVYWGSNVEFSGTTGTQTLDAFYTAVVQSTYYDWLNNDYSNNGALHFGRGQWVTRYDYTTGKTGSIADSDIQTGLASLIDGGKVPAPDANTLYAIHFAPGIDITMSDGSASCVQFCAYHMSFSHNGTNVYYSVNPDQGGSCKGGCGSDPSLFNNTTSVASHELVEATTDPNVGGSANTDIAWYDDTNGEIGDICNAQQCSGTGTAYNNCPTSYIVQLEWSNKYKSGSTTGACIAQNPSIAPANDFSMTVSPGMTVEVPVGGTATATITLAKTAGNADNVTFSASSLPTDVTAAFNPTSATSAGGTTTVTFTASASATPGSSAQSVTVKGAGAGGESHTATVMVQVVAPPDMAMNPPDMASSGNGGHGGSGGGGNGGTGGGGNGGTGGGGSGGTGNGTGGNGQGGNSISGNNGGGCSIGGGSIAGTWAMAALVLLALAFRRRRA